MRKKLLVRLVNKLYSRDCKKTVGSFKDRIASLLKTNTTDNYRKPTPVKYVYKGENVIQMIEEKIVRDSRDLCEHEEEEDYYKPVRVDNFWSNNYIEYESNSYRKKH